MSHALLSPSGRHRWGLCPGSIRLTRHLPPEPSGPSAIDGTHTHSLLDLCVREKLTKARMAVGRTITDHEGTFVVDVDRADRTQIVLDYVESRLKLYPGAQVISERKVSLMPLVGNDYLDGTVDLTILLNDLPIEIIDLKDGFEPVEASRNPQLEQYAIGALVSGVNLQTLPNYELRMTIVQPRNILRNVPAVSSYVRSTFDLLTVVLEEIRAQMIAALSDDAPLNPGPKQCRFCRIRGTCTAAARFAMQEIGLLFGPVPTSTPTTMLPSFLAPAPAPTTAAPALPAPTNSGPAGDPFTLPLPLFPALDMPTQAANIEPEDLPDERLVAIMEAAPMVRKLLESVDAEALRRLKAGKVIKGLKLVNGKGSSSWAKPEEEMVEVLQRMGIPKASLYISKLVSPAQTKKLSWTKRDGTPQQLTERQISRLDKEFIIRTAGSLVVVPESDSRPAVSYNVSHMFAPVGDQSQLQSPDQSPAAEATNPQTNPEINPPAVEAALPSWLTR